MYVVCCYNPVILLNFLLLHISFSMHLTLCVHLLSQHAVLCVVFAQCTVKLVHWFEQCICGHVLYVTLKIF